MLQQMPAKNYKTKKGNFSLVLKENGTNQCSYKISRQLFDKLKKYLAPFRSYQTTAKPVRCLETGQIFSSVRNASQWVETNKQISYCDMNLIKQACKGKQKTSYGYHWEFVEE